MKEIRILAVDDHEMTIVGYKFVLDRMVFENHTLSVEVATTYEEAKTKIETSAKSKQPYDVLLLDIQLFPPHHPQPQTGVDLAKLSMAYGQKSKIAFMSSFGDNFRINTIMQTINPDGYLVKSDIVPDILEEAIRTIILDPPYYSKNALQAIRKKMAAEFSLDDNDMTILYHLSIGTKTKDLEQYVTLSSSSIENRKRHLKFLFGSEGQNDLALILAARKKGFI